jgi:prevent-host-death family protein
MEIGAFEAKNKLSALLDRVELGEVIVITRHGKPIAKLVPDTGEFDRSQAAAASQRIRARAQEMKAGPLDWQSITNDRSAGRP